MKVEGDIDVVFVFKIEVEGRRAQFGALGDILDSCPAEALGVKMSGVGIAERAERMIIFAFSSIVAFFFLEILDWSILLLAVLTNFTVLQRGAHFLRCSRD